MPNITPAQIRKFYADNKNAVLFGAGVIVGGTAAALAARHGIKSVSLVSADLYAMPEKDMNVLHVVLSNGSKRLYEFRVTPDAVIS